MSHFTDIPKIGDVVETIFPYSYFGTTAYHPGIKCCAFCGCKPDYAKYTHPLNLECEAQWGYIDETHVQIIKPCNKVHNAKSPSFSGNIKSAYVCPPGSNLLCARKCCAFCGCQDQASAKNCGVQYVWVNNDDIVLLTNPCPEILKGKIWTATNSLAAVIADTTIKEYKSIKDIPKCTCKDVVNFGCTCGAMLAERNLLRVKKG
jgi:hypothetical protein